MLIINIPKKHGVIAYFQRSAVDVTDENKKIFSNHYVRIGQTEEEYGDVNSADWLCEIHINSIQQAQDYAYTFQKIADNMREEQ